MRKFALILIVSTISLTATTRTEAEVPQTEEALPELAVIAEAPYISDFGRQVTEDFLVQFLSIFSFGFAAEHNTLVWHDWQATYDGKTVFRDQAGNIIEDAPFIFGDAFAFRYSLYYLGNNGIPDVFINFGIPNSGIDAGILHRFIDNDFIAIDFFSPSPLLFRTEEGRLIALFSSELGGERLGYYYVTFKGSELILEPIVIDYDHSTWWDFHSRWQRRADGTSFLDIDTIFGTDIPITHLPRLTELEAEITASIMERLGLSQ